MNDEQKIEILTGKLDPTLKSNFNIIKIYLSVSRAEFTHELKYLVEHTIPYLKDYFHKNYSIEFQLISKEWEIIDEITEEESDCISFEEINNCKLYSNGPCFVALLGDQYERSNLLLKIKSSELTQLKQNMDPNDYGHIDENEVSKRKKFKFMLHDETLEFNYHFTTKDLFEINYKLDENSIPNYYYRSSRNEIVKDVEEILNNVSQGGLRFSDFLKGHRVFRSMIDKEYKNKLEKIVEKEKEITSKIKTDLENKILEEIYDKTKKIIKKSSEILLQAGKIENADKYLVLLSELSYHEYNQLKENMTPKELSICEKRSFEFHYGENKLPIEYNLKINDIFARIYRPFFNNFRLCEEKNEILKEAYDILDLESNLDKIIQQEVDRQFNGGKVQETIQSEIERKILQKFLNDEIEGKLRDLMRQSANSLIRKKLFTKDERDKYFISSNELEINEGILKLTQKEAEERTLVFYRTIKSKDETHEIEDLDAFVDSVMRMNSVKNIDAENVKLLSELKEKINKKVSTNNIVNFETYWDGASQSNLNYLENFGKTFQEKIIYLFTKTYKISENNVFYYNNMPEWKKVVFEDHIENYNIRKSFVENYEERTDMVIEKIGDYIQSDETKPLVIYGQSGSGKSALIAHVSDELHKLRSQLDNNYIVITKFLGMTKHGTNAPKILKILLNHIFIILMDSKFGLMQKKFGSKSKTYLESSKIPDEIFELHDELHLIVRELKELMNSSERFFNEDTVFILLLDGIEQLSSKSYDLLEWIVLEIPKNFKIIYTTSSNNDYDKLKKKLKDSQFFKLESLNADLSLNFLFKLLNKSNRKINSSQAQYIKKFLKNNENECQPLYLKILYYITKKWSSNQPYDVKLDKCTTIDSLVKYLFQLHYAHDNYLSILFYFNQFFSGITESELEGILINDDDFRMEHIGRWHRLKYELKEFFIFRNENNTPVMFWANKLIKDITKQLCTFKNDSYNKKIESILNFFQGNKNKTSINHKNSDNQLFFIDSNLTLKFNSRKIKQLPYLILKHNDLSKKKELLTQCIYFNYNFIYATALLSDFDFLSEVKHFLIEIKCTNLLIMHTFYEKFHKILIKNPCSILEQARFIIFDLAISERHDQILKFLGKIYSDESLLVLSHSNRNLLTLEPRSALVPLNSAFLLNLNQLKYTNEFIPTDLAQQSEDLKEFIWFFFNNETRKIAAKRILEAYDITYKQEVNFKNILLFHQQNESKNQTNIKKIMELEDSYQEKSAQRTNLGKFLKFFDVNLSHLFEPKMNSIITCSTFSFIVVIENIFNVEGNGSKFIIYDYKNNIEIAKDTSTYCFYLNAIISKWDSFVSSNFKKSNFFLLTMNLFDPSPSYIPFTCLNLIDLEGNLERKFELNEMFRDYLVLPFNYLLTIYSSYFEIYNLTNGEIIKGNISKPIVRFTSNIDKTNLIVNHTSDSKVYLVFVLEDNSIQIFEILFSNKKLTIHFKYEKVAISYAGKEAGFIKHFELKTDRKAFINSFENENKNENLVYDHKFKFALTVNYKLYIFEVDNIAFSFKMYDLTKFGTKNKENEVKLVDFYKNLIILRIEANTYSFYLDNKTINLLSRKMPIEAFQSINILNEFTIEMNINYFCESFTGDETILLYFIDPNKKKLLAIKYQGQVFFSFGNRIIYQTKDNVSQMANAEQLLFSFIDNQQILNGRNIDCSIANIINPFELLGGKFLLDFHKNELSLLFLNSASNTMQKNQNGIFSRTILTKQNLNVDFFQSNSQVLKIFHDKKFILIILEKISDQDLKKIVRNVNICFLCFQIIKDTNNFKKVTEIEIPVRLNGKQLEIENIEFYKALNNISNESVKLNEKSLSITLFENVEKSKILNINAKDSSESDKSNELWPCGINKIDLMTINDNNFNRNENKIVLFTELNKLLVVLCKKSIYLIDYESNQLKLLAKNDFNLNAKCFEKPINYGRISDTDTFVTMNTDGSLCFISIENSKFKILTSEKKGIEFFELDKRRLVAKDNSNKILIYDLNEIITKNYIPKALIYLYNHPVRGIYLNDNNNYILIKGEDFKFTMLSINSNQIRKVSGIVLHGNTDQIIFNEQFIFMFMEKSEYEIKKRKKIISLAIVDQLEKDLSKSQLNFIQNIKPSGPSLNEDSIIHYLNNDRKSQFEELYRTIIKSKEFSMRKVKIDRETFEGNSFENVINGYEYETKSLQEMNDNSESKSSVCLIL